MKKLWVFLIALFVPLQLFGQCFRGCPTNVQVAVLSDNRGTLGILPSQTIDCRHGRGSVTGVIEAIRGERYKIRVTNNSHHWLGFVISVDGRNIISGTASNLGSSERMYVLAPHSDGLVAGWRSSMTKVNRFFFTDQHDSFAGKWGDYSNMGSIKVAAFHSQQTSYDHLRMQESDKDKDVPRASAERGKKMRNEAMGLSQACPPGTGYGEGQWSPTQTVDFRPEYSPYETWHITYRWQDTYSRPFYKDRLYFPREDDSSDFAHPPRR